MTAAVLQCCSSGSGQGGLRPLVGGRAPRPGAGMTLQGGSLHVDTTAVLQSTLGTETKPLCVWAVIRPPPPCCSAAVPGLCLLPHHCILVTGLSGHNLPMYLPFSMLCKSFLKFCFLKCPQADLILPLYPPLKMPGQAIYPSPPASLSCSAVHFSVSSPVRLSAG